MWLSLPGSELLPILSPLSKLRFIFICSPILHFRDFYFFFHHWIFLLSKGEQHLQIWTFRIKIWRYLRFLLPDISTGASFLQITIWVIVSSFLRLVSPAMVWNWALYPVSTSISSTLPGAFTIQTPKACICCISTYFVKYVTPTQLLSI